MNKLVNKVKKVVEEKDRGGKEIIAELALMGIAVALLVAYKATTSSFMTTFMSEATTAISGLLTI